VQEVLDSRRLGSADPAGRDVELNEEPVGNGRTLWESPETDAGAGDAGDATAGQSDAAASPDEPPDGGRSPDPSVCPFLRYDEGGRQVAPQPMAVEFQECVAIGVPRVQSLRQQELVCLQPAHVDCPRYLRGQAALPVSRTARAMPSVPKATVAALLILALSAAISFGYVAVRGGLELPTPASSPRVSADAALETSEPEATDASVAALPTDDESPTATTEATPGGEPTAEPTVAPTPKPTPRSTPTSDRYALLKPCPDRDGCWIYTVRSGDNLTSIANYFGVKLATIYAWNPTYANGGRLRAGAGIRMPPPTR